MGSWFSNINIKKNENVSVSDIVDYFEKVLASDFERISNKDEADGTVVILSGESSHWFTVYTDIQSFNINDDFEKTAEPMSSALGTDVLGIACFDSDYLFLNLINAADGLNAWVGVGSASGLGIKRRTGLNAWKNKVEEFSVFSQNAKKKYVLAEEFLVDTAGCLGLPAPLSMASFMLAEEAAPGTNADHLYFKRKLNSASKERVRLVTYGKDYSLPCFDGRENIVSAVNVGTAASGLTVMFLGPYVENEEITFSDVRLVANKQSTPVQLTRIQTDDGNWAFCFYLPDFCIPSAVPDQLPKSEKSKLLFERSFSVKFTPRGNRKMMLDITIEFIPDANPQGKAVWNIWSGYETKKKYIQKYNRNSKLLRSFETDPENWLPLIDGDIE